MDIDVLKSASGDHADVTTMMLEMDQKLAADQFSNPFDNRTPCSDFFPSPNLGVSPSSAASTFFNPIIGSSLFPDHHMTQTASLQLQPSWARAKLKTTCGAFSAANPYDKRSSMTAMREMIFRIAAMQPIYIDPESIKPPKRRNVRISKDPQSVAARHRRERISEKIRILQRLVPGGTKMDTASMLDEAVHYVKFLKKQVQALEQAGAGGKPPLFGGLGFSGLMIENNYSTSLNCANVNYSSALLKACQQPPMVGSLQMH